MLLLMTLAGGVGCWTDSEMIDRAVWSDDDTGQAYVRLFFEEGPKVNPLSMTHPRRNYQHQLYLQNADGSDRHAITGVRDHQSGGSLFYMRGAGYVIVDVLEGEGVSRFDLVRLPGGEVSTIRTYTASGQACTGLEVVPSRDGLILAVIERTASAETDARCPRGEAVVTFVDAATLSTLSSYHWPVSDMIQTFWTDAGDLVVSAPQDGAWRVDPEAGPAPVAPPTCVPLQTSSSSLSADGVLIGGGLSADEPITVFPPAPPGGEPYTCE